MAQKANSLALVNAINEYATEHELNVQEIIYACEIVKASILEGIMGVLIKK